MKNNYFIVLNSASPNMSVNENSSGSVNYNEGFIQLFSYNKIVRETNALANEATDGEFGDLIIVCNEDYYELIQPIPTN